MKSLTILRKWWVILLQGILMIVLSILIFNNPDAVLAGIAFWLGAIVIVSGLIGVISWFGNEKESRDLPVLLASMAMVFIGVLMISKIFVTISAITFVFGLLTTILGLVLISGGWNGRKEWSFWWVIALLGVATLIVGIKSILDVNAGAENISTLIGVAVLLSGLGLVGLALLKKSVVKKVANKIADAKQEYRRNLN